MCGKYSEGGNIACGMDMYVGQVARLKTGCAGENPKERQKDVNSLGCSLGWVGRALRVLIDGPREVDSVNWEEYQSDPGSETSGCGVNEPGHGTPANSTMVKEWASSEIEDEHNASI